MNKQSVIMKIPDPRRKSETQQMHQCKNMFCETCGIGVMFSNFQITFMIQQVIKYMS